MSNTPRYLTLAVFKQYLIGTRTDPLNPTVFNGAVTGTPDDNILNDAIIQAESAFDRMCGTGYDEQTYEAVQPIQSFVDGNGWLNLLARERVPVTAVSAVSIRNVYARNTTWQAITWDAGNDIILPNFAVTDTYPRPDAARVQIYPNPVLSGAAPDQILVRWDYAGGFATIPDSLQLIIAEIAVFLYKMRENPTGRIVNTAMGTTSNPLGFPPYIMDQVTLWMPSYG